jgi:hypothetical protein
MYCDNDIAQDSFLDFAFEGLLDVRERRCSFVYLLNSETDAELPELSSDVYIDEMNRYLHSNSLGYSSDLTTADSFDAYLHSVGSAIPPCSRRSEVCPPRYCGAVPMLATRQIGSLSLEERSIKVKRYQEKRLRRVWSKKINYGCRKRVADNRMRIKGRFVAKDKQPTSPSSGVPRLQAMSLDRQEGYREA